MNRFRSDDAPMLIHAAHADAGLTRAKLARRTGLRQPSLTQMESGARPVSKQILERVLCAADHRPSVPLSTHADEITKRAWVYGLEALRVFGSVVRGGDGFDPDIDLVVTPPAGTDLFGLVLFVHEVEELTGFPASVVSGTNVPATLADAMREVVPLWVKDATRRASHPAPVAKPRTCATGRISMPNLS